MTSVISVLRFDDSKQHKLLCSVKGSILKLHFTPHLYNRDFFSRRDLVCNRLLVLFIGSFRAQISDSRPANLSEVFRGFLPSFQAYTIVLPLSSPGSLLFTSFASHVIAILLFEVLSLVLGKTD